ncbi:hypothetical protein NQ318_021700 [Aromia moschata]|uniref:Endoglucanase n=1 Tax=Aromia moschata TaxID=1265417 RepID=A0AAV8YFJ7_9CUCU|nr:hypothetical protein NQ318_021700 [Aromia moschata]
MRPRMSKIQTLLTVFFSILTINVSCFHLHDFKPNYKEALRLSLLFYESQRSGKLPTNKRIEWRGDSALEDKGINGEDLTGGYYDGSDFVKFSFTMAFTSTMLSWGIKEYEDAYKEAGQYFEVLDAVKWATDYFIKCHVSPNEFYGQVGDFVADHAFWGRPEEMNMTRPAYKIDAEHPGSDLAGEASAMFSSASVVFKSVNETYSKELLRHAVELYEFAKNYRGLYQDVIPGAKQYYESSSYGDELTWAALWLYRATDNPKYLDDAEKYYEEFKISEEGSNKFYYNEKVAGLQVQYLQSYNGSFLADSTGATEYFESAQKFCDNAVDKQLRTPKGLIYINKLGTLSHASNVAFLCLRVADLPRMDSKKYVHFAKEQIDYILGAKGRSFVVGYGYNYPKRPYHSASSCPAIPQPCNWEQFHSTLPNPQVLHGALVSGPDQKDFYEDSREEFTFNEVTLDFNAGFQSALAGLIHHESSEKY